MSIVRGCADDDDDASGTESSDGAGYDRSSFRAAFGVEAMLSCVVCGSSSTDGDASADDDMMFTAVSEGWLGRRMWTEEESRCSRERARSSEVRSPYGRLQSKRALMWFSSRQPLYKLYSFLYLCSCSPNSTSRRPFPRSCVDRVADSESHHRTPQALQYAARGTPNSLNL